MQCIMNVQITIPAEIVQTFSASAYEHAIIGSSVQLTYNDQSGSHRLARAV